MIHAVTFRIDYDANYDKRYESVVAAIKAQAEGQPAPWWADPTSFFLIRSSKEPAAFTGYVESNSKFDAKRDLLLVIHVSGKQGHSIIGSYPDKDVLTLLQERSK